MLHYIGSWNDRISSVAHRVAWASWTRRTASVNELFCRDGHAESELNGARGGEESAGKEGDGAVCNHLLHAGLLHLCGTGTRCRDHQVWPSQHLPATYCNSLKHVVRVSKISSFQVAGVLERHPAGERKRKRVSDTWAFHLWKEQTKQKKQTRILTLPLACFVLTQIGVISGSFREASVWVELVSGSERGAARLLGDTHSVAERRDPAAPGSVHAAQHSQRDERGELTLHRTLEHLHSLHRQRLDKVTTSCRRSAAAFEWIKSSLFWHDWNVQLNHSWMQEDEI